MMPFRFGVEEVILVLLPARGTELTDTYLALAELAGMAPYAQ